MANENQLIFLGIGPEHLISGTGGQILIEDQISSGLFSPALITFSPSLLISESQSKQPGFRKGRPHE